MADLSQTKLMDLLPASIRDDPDVQAAAAAIDNELQAVTAAIPETVLIARIDVLPEAVLDLLAWQWHVDFYEPIGFAIAKKRAVIKQSIAWHRHKGTPWAVEQVVSAVFANAEIEEWFDYGGDPYHFKIRTIDSLQNAEAYTLLRRAIDVTKNTRSWLDSIQIEREVTLSGDNGLKIGIVNGTGGQQTIGLPYPTRADVELRTGVAHRTGGRQQVRLSVPTQCRESIHTGVLNRRGGRLTIGSNPEFIPQSWYEQNHVGRAHVGR